MKRFILFTFSILLTFTFAIAQDGINYQGAATDANGDELTNQNITIRASVLSTSANGNLEWEETHSATTDQFGLFNVVIGQGTNTTNGATALFDDMDWGSGNHFLKIEMDATGGTNYAMIGTTQMMSVPYALYAKSAGIDSAAIAGMIGSSGGGMGGGCDFDFPEGLNGEIITEYLTKPSNYSVPSGKTLYITNWYSISSNLEIILNGTGRPIAREAYPAPFDGIVHPIILRSGDIIETSSSSGQGWFNGILIPSKSEVEPLSVEVSDVITYTVPSGKMYVITNAYKHSGTEMRINSQSIIKADNALTQQIFAKSGDLIDAIGGMHILNGYLVDQNYFAGCGGGGGSSSSASAVDSAMVAGMIANAGGGGTGDWELLYDCLNCGQTLPWGTVDRFGEAESDGFLYVIAHDITVFTGDDFDSTTTAWTGDYNNQLLQNNYPALIPLKKDMSWHIQFHSTAGEVRKAYFIPNSGGGSSTVSSSGNGSGCDFKYPDGLNGEVVNLDLANDYTVPSGKTLYINHVFLYGEWLKIDGERIIMGYSNSSNLNNSHHPRSNGLNSPLIVGSSSVLSVENGYSTDQQIQGILMDEGVQVMNLDLANNYTVPSGKTLYLTNIYLYGDYLYVDGERIIMGYSNSSNLNNSHHPPSNGLNSPLIVGSGSVLSVENGYATDQQVNGYLVDENYFANCGGGGGGSSNSSAGLDSVTVATMIANAVSTTNSSTSVSTFGDTLFINGQAIIIPGISFQNATPSFGTVTDIDGNTYQTIDHGLAGEWMIEDLRVTKFTNGDVINQIIGTNSNSSSTCNNPAYIINNSYGYLGTKLWYNLPAVRDSRGICPNGWHVATEQDYMPFLDLFSLRDTTPSYFGIGNGYHFEWYNSGPAFKKQDGGWDNSNYPEGQATNQSYLGFESFDVTTCTNSNSFGPYMLTDHRSWTGTPGGPNGGNLYLKINKNNDLVTFSDGYSDTMISCRCVKD